MPSFPARHGEIPVHSVWCMILVTLACSILVQAQLLFPANLNQIPFESDRSRTSGEGNLWNEARPPRVAIIGAGAGGSSAAHFLAHFSNVAPGLDTLVTVFEADKVGGRSTVVWPWNDDPEESPLGLGEDETEHELPVEAGASIFVAANKNLQRAVKKFNLTTEGAVGEDGSTAIWDGTRWVYEESSGWGWGWWDISKMLWRYGRSPLKVRSLVKETVGSFLSLYTSEFICRGPHESITTFAEATNLSHPASMHAKDYFSLKQISPLFTNELVAAATAVNYRAPVSQIHGVGALVSLAANGAVSVKGGNRKIFEAFLGSSEANLRLGASGTVTQVIRLDKVSGKRPQYVVKTADGGGGTFDIIILAAPYHQTKIDFVNTGVKVPQQAYVHLHVTFIITNSSAPRPAYFGLPENHRMPNSIFATFDTGSTPPPTFNSLNYLKRLSPETGARFGNTSNWHVVKMFSYDTLSDKMLRDVFGQHEVAKTYEKVFLAYPKLDPIESPSEVAPVRPATSFYYINGMERLVSTMETETVSAFNVVTLLLKDLFGYTATKSWAEWDED